MTDQIWHLEVIYFNSRYSTGSFRTLIRDKNMALKTVFYNAEFKEFSATPKSSFLKYLAHVLNSVENWGAISFCVCVGRGGDNGNQLRILSGRPCSTELFNQPLRYNLDAVQSQDCKCNTGWMHIKTRNIYTNHLVFEITIWFFSYHTNIIPILQHQGMKSNFFVYFSSTQHCWHPYMPLHVPVTHYFNKWLSSTYSATDNCFICGCNE